MARGHTKKATLLVLGCCWLKAIGPERGARGCIATAAAMMYHYRTCLLNQPEGPELGQSIDSGEIDNAQEAAGHEFDNGYYSRRLIVCKIGPSR